MSASLRSHTTPTGTTDLLKPRMEIRRRHQQHPQTQPHHHQRRTQPPLRNPLVTLIITHDLPLRPPHPSTPPRHPPLLPQPPRAHNSRQNLQPQKRTPKHQYKNMPANIMSTLPHPTHSLTSLSREKLLPSPSPLIHARQLARTPRDAETAID